ncbi:MAG: hypothetical protein WC059_00705 [Candidatus Paceibacterota bacterium]
MKKIIYFLVVIMFFGVSSSTVYALTVSPARIELSGKPGDTIHKDITLLNENKTTSQTFFISFANFEAQGETGSPHFIEPTNDIGTWMNAPSSITVPPGGSKNVSVSISIPKDASSGGHFGAIFFGTAPSATREGQVAIAAKTGVLVLLSVVGDINEAGGLLSFATKNKKFFHTSLPVHFEYRFRNDGNDRVKPEGKITIRNTVWYPTKRIDANQSLGNVLPGSTRLFEVQWLEYSHDDSEPFFGGRTASFFRTVQYQWKNFALGPYFAKLSLVYGNQQQTDIEHLVFFVFPWHLMLVVVCIGAVLFLGGRQLLKKYNTYIIKRSRAPLS